jgi:NADH-quinone oxidoreductase subunit J
MIPVQIAFIVLSAITLLCGLAVVTVRNLFHAALYLIGALFGVALLYILLEAGFLAIAQILIYIGAIAILIIFAVMLTRGVMSQVSGLVNAQWIHAAIIAALLFALLGVLLWQFPWQATNMDVPNDSLYTLGKALVTPDLYMLPFEAASVMLLAGLVGAIYVARDRK